MGHDGAAVIECVVSRKLGDSEVQFRLRLIKQANLRDMLCTPVIEIWNQSLVWWKGMRSNAGTVDVEKIIGHKDFKL
tara:strand:- start:15223 stop:15453 length:231 start_codon:yes stop_codon:yes gene_type:complete